MSAKTGGHAFPALQYNMPEGCNPSGGMPLRDYFAAKAMQALLQTPAKNWPEGYGDSVSAASYRMADKMLAAREAK